MENECFHVLIVCLLTVFCSFGIHLFSYFERDNVTQSNQTKWFLYAARILPLLALLPVAFSNFFGFLLFKIKRKPHRLKTSTLFAPFICFRVYNNNRRFREDVVFTIEQNVKTCLNAGLKNFMFEIVGEQTLGIPSSKYIREIIVPSKYRTVQISYRKARALHYCFENDVNILCSDDWIVHLNVATEISQDSVIDIVNFIYDDRYCIGQGRVTCRNRVINVFSIMADSMRVAMDYGLSRFTFGLLHVPLFGVKSTFLVCKVAIEKQIGFDFGGTIEHSVENLMVLKAWQYGFKVGLLNSEMYESATSSYSSYLGQRRIIFSEILQTLSNPHIHYRHKSGVFLILVNAIIMHFAVSYFILHWLFPLSRMYFFTLSYGFIFGLTYFMYLFGTFKTHSHIENRSLKQYLKILFITISVIPCSLIIESSALYLSLLSRRKTNIQPTRHRSEWNELVV